MAFGTATLTGFYQTFDGEPAEGVVEIIPNSRQLVDAEGNTILAGRVKRTLVETERQKIGDDGNPVVDELGNPVMERGGAFVVTLPATDDATVEPAGTPDAPRQYTVVAKLRHTHLAAVTGIELATGATVDVADVASAAEVDATATRWYETDATISGAWDFTSAPTVNGSPIGTGGGGGAVDSVNGKTGAVSLTAADVGAETPAGAQAKATAAENAAKAASTPVAHATDTNNPHAVTKAQVGLGSVDNTADLEKPISTATAAALAAKQDAATLDADTAALVDDTGAATGAALSATFAPLRTFDIGNYGAVAGAATGNRAAIQAAIDAAHAAGGGEVIVPEGQYGIEGWIGAGSNTAAFYGLRLKNGVHLRGAGPKSVLTAIDLPGAGGQGAFIGNDQTASGDADIWISDLTIDLGATSLSSSAAGIMFGNPHTNIAAVPVERPRIKGVTVRNSPYLGIQLCDGCTDFQVVGCHVENVYYIGIQVQGSSYGVVKDNIVLTTGDNGIDLSGENGAGASATHHVTVSGNVVRSALNGIFLETAAFCGVIGNTIEDSSSWGIVVNRINSTTTGNSITGNTLTGSGEGCIKLANNSNDTAITGNTLRLLASTKGVRADACYRGAIAGNSISGPSGDTTGVGVEFNSTSAWFTISANVFADLANDITINSGSFGMAYGLNAYGGSITTILA